MKKARHTVFLLLSTSLLACGFHASAQVVNISGCRAIEDRLQRFDCYESLEAADASDAGVPQPQAPRTAAPVQSRVVDTAPAPAPATREQPATLAPQNDQAVSTFGTRSEPPSARVAEDEDGRAELLDTIAALEQRGPNLWLITLESGQKWAQMLSKRYPVNAGDDVRIYPTRFGGAYRLTAPRLSGFIQVQRMD